MTKTGKNKESYEYILPDHWILDREAIWTVMHDSYVERVVEILESKKTATVLEIGCGDGWNCNELVKRGIKVLGIDWSKNGIEHARRLVPEAEFILGDIRDPSFFENRSEFDAVILVEVIEHVPPDECSKLLQDVAKFVKSNGTIVVTTPSVNLPNNNPGHYRHFTKEILAELVQSIPELKIELIEGYGNLEVERKLYRYKKLIDNKYWTIKPLKRWLSRRYLPHCKSTPIETCHGFVVVLNKIT